MSEEKLKEQIIERFGINLYQKVKDFPKNKINILYYKASPLKIRSIILDNEREFHLIIDEKKGEIFHDCPSFLIYPEINKKICVHLLKILSIINENLALNVLNHIEKYNLTHEDYGSRKKSKNYLFLANSCISENNLIEGLSFLNKAIINQKKCRNIINRYLLISINNNLFLEFFNFLRYGLENDLGDFFIPHEKVIKKGFQKFLNSLSKYYFYDLLQILHSIDEIFEFGYLSLLEENFPEIKKMNSSLNFNEKYFSFYIIKKYINSIRNDYPDFNEQKFMDDLNIFKEDLIHYFRSQIENFCLIDMLKFIKKHFKIFQVPKNRFQEEYSKYKQELKELERKLYLKKFAFLKVLIEQHGLNKTNANFRKKRNTYVISHDPANLEKPVYHYILSRIGFLGIKELTIKSSEIGYNYYIFKELFSDDLTAYSDVMYYKNQFWGEEDKYAINILDGHALFSKINSYDYQLDQQFSDINDIIIIEWDLVNKPIQGSIVQAYGNQIIIPDINNPLFFDIKPFDLCYCKKKTVKIEANIIKSVNVISKCSFEDAIKNIQKGMAYIEGFYPLSLVRKVIQKETSPFEAFRLIIKNANREFIPNYGKFVLAFKKFLIEFIEEEKEYIFNELKNDLEEKTDQLLIILDLKRELDGLNIDFSEIIKKIPKENFNLKSFKITFIKEIHAFIENLLKERKIGTTNIFELNKMRNTPFSKYFKEILKIRKEEFENSEILRENSNYDLSLVKNTYYGQKIMELLGIEGKEIVNEKLYDKFMNLAFTLNLKPRVVEKNRD
ncbi:MAG: hypothetical protein ACTSYC_12535 [Promethearchaeota archaeon]